jgi:hypothetical protein
MLKYSFIKICTNYYGVTYFKFSPATACTWHNFYLEKLTFYGMGLKKISCVVLVRTAADEIRITIFLNLSE